MIKEKTLNRYGQQYGYHTPKRTKNNFLNIVRRTNMEWIDASWHNDLCDSMHHCLLETETEHIYIEIFLPNSEEQDEDNEEFNGFTLTNEKNEILLETEDRVELCDYINKYYKL